MIRPDKNKYPVTQYFGQNPYQYGYGVNGHDGIDIGTPTGAPLYAPRSGKVIQVDEHPAFGLRIVVDNGTNKDYIGHLSEAQVKVWDKVVEGQQIALSGASGNVTGPHTHWGVYEYTTGRPIDPNKELERVNAEMAQKLDLRTALNLAEAMQGDDPNNAAVVADVKKNPVGTELTLDKVNSFHDSKGSVEWRKRVAGWRNYTSYWSVEIPKLTDKIKTLEENENTKEILDVLKKLLEEMEELKDGKVQKS